MAKKKVATKKGLKSAFERRRAMMDEASGYGPTKKKKVAKKKVSRKK
jgi:hypothetical protein